MNQHHREGLHSQCLDPPLNKKLMFYLANTLFKLTCAIFVSFSTFRAFLNGVGVRGDTLKIVLLMRGVRKGSSVEVVSSKPGVFSVVFVMLI